MIPVVKRDLYTNQGVFGKLYYEGSVIAHTLEPPAFNNISSKSCIKCGKYFIIKKYSPRFKMDLYELQSVPDRTNILIHVGNTYLNTEGCILLGDRRSFINGLPAVSDSRAAVQSIIKLFDSLIEAPLNGLYIEIKGEF